MCMHPARRVCVYPPPFARALQRVRTVFVLVEIEYVMSMLIVYPHKRFLGRGEGMQPKR